MKLNSKNTICVKTMLFRAIESKISADENIAKIIDNNIILGNIYDKNNNNVINDCIKININKIKSLNENKAKTEIDIHFFVHENHMEQVLDAVNNIFEDKWISIDDKSECRVDLFLKKMGTKVDGKKSYVAFNYMCYAMIDEDFAPEETSPKRKKEVCDGF